MIHPNGFRQQIVDFVTSQSSSQTGEYIMGPGGQVTLYASCFAAMTLHYLGALPEQKTETLRDWAAYIQKWQDPDTGLFLGPEVLGTEITHPKHDWEHVTMHLTAHVLPALHLLGEQPRCHLRFAHRFLDVRILNEWLTARDWSDAWLEGNNLLFVGQFLIHLRDRERRAEAEQALKYYFDWLDDQVDPHTGLWGTNAQASIPVAIYGAYHQLLVYHYAQRPVRHATRIMDLVLEMQHQDGSFMIGGGGGACEDLDGVDMLVNLYKQTGYRPLAVRRALRRALDSVLSQLVDNSGFVYRKRSPMNLLGLSRTNIAPNTADLFSTWFRVHTLALIFQVIQEYPLSRINWQFNHVCSMGWHRPDGLPTPQPNPWQDKIALSFLQKEMSHLWINSVLGRAATRLKNSIVYRVRHN